ncbi:formate dehydrogenase major subunit [Halogeometricum rufum]|uniref:Formate dehydrogenase major subunit n=2 Tax=Halogeometricum rufum TaxID=553469 RepID=A0A1I6IF58_9EURY|nr:formate dehydrogenase subunit alpha [Halogeometricum rufum]SFR65372.1 formate dehydrogenase major subunit [Halogeometricum rufum]
MSDEELAGVAGYMQRAKEQAMQNVEHVAEGVAADTLSEGKLFEIAQAVGDKRLEDLNVADTTCGYCAVGCRFDLYSDGEEILAARPTEDEDAPVNGISTCVKGKFGYDFVNSDDRLTTPLVRDENDEFREASWEEALDRVAEGLGGIRDEHGGDALSVIASSKATNEENYLMGKFARQVLGTNSVDNCNRLCHSSTVAGLAATYGYGAASISVEDLELADCILLTGSNTTEAHPVLATRIKQNVRDGADLLVFDPREVQIAEYATQYSRVKPGYDAVWINGITRYIVNNDLHDEAFVEERTTGFEDVKEAVQEFTPERVEEVTGVPREEIVSAAETIAEADTCVFGWTLGLTEHSHGTENVMAMANLAAVTGNLGKPGTGVSPFRGQNNVQGGGGDMGPLPDNFPGYQDIADDEIRAKFEEAWDCDISPEYGHYTTQMFLAADDERVRGMYIIGENAALSEPGVNHAEEILADLDFLVVQDLFVNETAQYADVVLPACSFVEKTGTFTNTDRTVQMVKQVMEPKGDSRPDWKILQDLANRMGRDWDYGSTAEIMEEVNSLTPLYGGVSHARVEAEGGLQWPCWDKDHPGTERLYTEEFNTDDGKAQMQAIGYSEPAELPDDEYPFTLTTGRVLYQYHTGTMTHREEGIMQYTPSDFVEIHPDTAVDYGIESGDMVRVESRRGEVTVPAQVTDRVGRDNLFVPIHFAESAVNRLTDEEHLDPAAATPEFKVSAVRIRPVKGEAEPVRRADVEASTGDD